MTEQNESAHEADSGFDRFRHVCVMYGSKDEEYRVLRSFIATGFKKGDKAFHIIDGKRRPDHLRRLREFDIDVEAMEDTGQLEVRGWEAAHLRPGWFDQQAMLSLAEGVLSESRSKGYPFIRWVANMGWALEDLPGAGDLVEYCARLNDTVRKHDATIICTYDLTQFSAISVIDVLRSHPVAVIGGIVHENPFYVPPENLLKELQQHQNTASSSEAVVPST